MTAVAYAPIHATVGGLLLRTRAIDCYDWSGLLGVPGKRGANREVPQQGGAAPRVRYGSQLRAALPVRVNGQWLQDGTRLSGPESAWHAQVYTHLAALHAIANVDTVQDLVVTLPAGPVTVDCQVEELTAPSFEVPWRCETVLDLTLPDGPLDLEGS